MNNESLLSDSELLDVVDLALMTGQMMMQFGAETERIQITIQRVGKAFGCDIENLLVTHNAIMITVTHGERYHTKIRYVVRQGVNFSILARVNTLAYEAFTCGASRAVFREKLTEAGKIPHLYNRWVVVVMVGLACGAFSQLFGGDTATFFHAWLGAAVGMFVRQEMTRNHYNINLVIGVSAFWATLFAGVSVYFEHDPKTALAACVLFLIPGVPLINSAQDLIKGYIPIGITRSAMGILITLSIAIGMMLALNIIGFYSL